MIRWSTLAVFAAFSLVGPLASVRAAITPIGDVSPSNPSGWTYSTTGYIGNTDSGTLTVDGGSDLVSATGYIGNSGTGSGLVCVTGSGSRWTFSNVDSDLYVGNSGSGRLNITSGGSIRITCGYSGYGSYIGYGSGSSGTATVDGAGSNLTSPNLYVGNSGSGTLNITGGGMAMSNGSFGGCLGCGSSSSGTATVAGSGSNWTISTLYVGNSGSGTLNITNGGTVSTMFSSYLGYGIGSSGAVTVDGPGSNLTTSIASCYVVGNYGTGNLHISNGGIVSSQGGYLGYYSGGTGTVTVDGQGTVWKNDTYSVIVGYSGSGALIITNGGSVTDSSGYLGYASGSLGTATVDGSGSAWANNSYLNVGNSGRGNLKITNGGSVSSYSAALGNASGASGTATVDGAGSKWTSSSSPMVFSVGGSGNGTLNIINGGNVSSYSATLGNASGASGTATVDEAGSTWTNTNYLSVGGSGNGALNIINGGSVSNRSASLGLKSGSSGTATVEGVASKWTNSSDFYVGDSGNGTLNIHGGGSVGDNNGYLGYASGSLGTAAVDGSGSKWTNSSSLFVGNSGSGTLSVTGGGAITAASVSMNSTSLTSVDVGRSSSLTVAGGTGAITNNGIVRIVAGAGVPVNNAIKYSPISAGTWSGSGVYQPVGGTWSTSNHTFTASSVSAGTAGSAVLLNLTAVQRALIDDTGTGGEVGASFVAATSTQNITFTATVMSGTTLDTLKSLLPTNESILSGWTFATTNYNVSSTNPVYLSFNVGTGYPADNLDLWHYDGSTWTQYTPTDLTYDGTFASFTATSFGGFAVAAVPEPSTLAVLAAGLLGLLVWALRRRRV